MADLLNFNGITKLDIPVDCILSGAAESDLQSVIVLGWDKEGEFYFASSMADGGDILWLLELTKKKLLEIEV